MSTKILIDEQSRKALVSKLVQITKFKRDLMEDRARDGGVRFCALFCAVDGALHITTSREVARLRVTIKGLTIEGASGVRVQANAKRLLDLCRGLGGPFIMSLNDEDITLLITDDFNNDNPEAKYRLAGREGADWAGLGPNTEGSGEPSLSSDHLSALTEANTLLKALDIAKDFPVRDGRMILTGVCFDLNGKTLELVATDGHKLVVCPIALTRKATDDGKGNFVLPLQVSKDLAGLLKGVKGDITIRFDRSFAFIVGPDFRLISHIVDGVFPEFRPLFFETKDAPRVTVDRQRLLEAMKTLKTLTDKIACTAVIKRGDDDLLITTFKPDELGCEGTIRVKAAFEGKQPDNDVACSIPYLSLVASKMTTDNVDLYFRGANESFEVHTPASETDNPDLEPRYIVMPVRV